MWKRAAAWLWLALILGVFLGYLAWLDPAAAFGFYHDDAVYFAAGQAVAQGRGQILPSLPAPGGAPVAIKYPPLYPWLLSWIWKWWPVFPANTGPAVGMTALFAVWFLVAAFQLLRGLAGVGAGPALFLVALCAFQRNTVLLSGAVLSDMLFLALALTAALEADAALKPNGKTMSSVATGVLAGLSVLARGFGWAVVAGIAAAALYRRAWRQMAVFGAAAVTVAAGALLPHTPLAAAAEGGGPGWQQTWAFYTSYFQFWKLSVPRLDVLLAMLAENLRVFLEAPAAACLFPSLGEGNSYFGTLLGITLTAGILAGIVRQARSQWWKPIHFVFPFYSAMTLVWNYGLMDRFLLLFLPLFYAGLWVEGKHLLSMLRESWRPGRPMAEKLVAGVLGAGLACVVVLAVVRYRREIPARSRATVARRAVLAREKGELYEWIRSHTNPDTRFVAYQDVSLYLHTGRQAIRPIAFSTEAFYKKDEKVLKRDLAHIMDVARYIGARYWVASEDDFQMETGRLLIDKRIAELKSVLPVVFHSRENKVQLYDLYCLHEPEQPACRAAVPVLFPST